VKVARDEPTAQELRRIASDFFRANRFGAQVWKSYGTAMSRLRPRRIRWRLIVADILVCITGLDVVQ
jgi:hypothetical protein